MIERDRKPFFTLIAGVYAFYDKGFSDFAGRVWWEAMKPFELAAVSESLNRHCINPDVGQFMPKPADVVRMLQGSTQDAALVAWSKLDRAVREVGTYRSAVFEDALIHRVVLEMGGWVQFGTKTEDEWPFLKNEFVNRYRGYRGRSEIPEYPPVLIGMAETSNRKVGFDSDPPVLIGNPVTAQAVMQRGSNAPILEFNDMRPADASKALRLVDSRGAA